MRKAVLGLVLLVIGVVVPISSSVSASGTRYLESTDIAVSANESSAAQLQIDVADIYSRLEVHILLCTEAQSETCNYENRRSAERWMCYSATSPLEGDACVALPTPFEINLFTHTEWLGDTAAIASGFYELKVVEYDATRTPDSNKARYVFDEYISDSSFQLQYDQAPTLTGAASVGSTLQLTTATWSPTPFSIELEWYRCNKTTQAFFIPGNQELPFEADGVTCRRINQDGSEFSLDVLLGVQNVRLIDTQDVSGFTQYEIRNIDIGSSITALVKTYATRDSRTYGVASTSVITAPVVEQRTKPVNQTAPKVSLKKTKKIKKLQVSATLTANPGTWSSMTTTKYQWYSCTKRQKSSTTVNTKFCKSIKRATKANYKVKKIDRNRFLMVVVTASNELGSVTITSRSTAKIK